VALVIGSNTVPAAITLIDARSERKFTAPPAILNYIKYQAGINLPAHPDFTRPPPHFTRPPPQCRSRIFIFIPGKPCPPGPKK
jgi:hypothetical protein